MEGLVALRPALLQPLLEACRSVKVKRLFPFPFSLFLYLADSTNPPWFRELDASRIELGSGKRVIVKGGVLVPHYGITVPREKGG